MPYSSAPDAYRDDMSSADLPALVRRAQAGDHLAYAQLVRRFQDMAVGYAYALLREHLAAKGQG